VHCHSSQGHSPRPLFPAIDLPTALRRSCNVYFAFVGDKYIDADGFRRLVSTFGFGRPTGVRSLPADLEGIGLREEFSFMGPLAEANTPLFEPQRQRLGNGLSHISVNPMQVARAYAGLATGVLPEMRLVQGRENLQRERVGETLPFSPEAFAVVRRALGEVVTHPQGSAHNKGLDRETLGFSIALKTGSADYRKGTVPNYPLPQRGRVEWVDGMRKHTWIAGWAPAVDPKLIFVVYVHDTATTSSHGAVYLAAALLASPAVRAYMSEVGVLGDGNR
jgi:cell division protein FtsI/penicillin-binding protein 2